MEQNACFMPLLAAYKYVIALAKREVLVYNCLAGVCVWVIGAGRYHRRNILWFLFLFFYIIRRILFRVLSWAAALTATYILVVSILLWPSTSAR